MDCPKCGLINPPSAQRCDCGYDFLSRQMKESYITDKQRRATELTIGGGTIAVLALVWLMKMLASLLTDAGSR